MELSIMAENDPALRRYFTNPLVVGGVLSKLEFVPGIVMKFNIKRGPRSSDNLRKAGPKIAIKIKDQCI